MGGDGGVALLFMAQYGWWWWGGRKASKVTSWMVWWKKELDMVHLVEEITSLGKAPVPLFLEFPTFFEPPLGNPPFLCCATRWKRWSQLFLIRAHQAPMWNTLGALAASTLKGLLGRQATDTWCSDLWFQVLDLSRFKQRWFKYMIGPTSPSCNHRRCRSAPCKPVFVATPYSIV